ncbi:MAG: DUF6569 family protein, partial [candidate division WOR-3 bacterium]
VETQSDLVVPTVCVEEGRWESKDANRFFSGRSVSYPTLRAILARNTIRGNRATDLKKSQRLIWQEIERKLSITRINSQTSSMHDLYDGLNDEISHYLEDIKGIEDICGVIAVVANKFLALDLFGSNELFKIFKEKLIKSYVLDALEHRDRVTSIPEGLPAKLVQELTEAKMVRLRSRGLGFEYRLEARRLLGRALVSQPKSRIGTRLLHLSLFPVN